MITIEGHTFDDDRLSPDSFVLDIGGNHGNFSAEILRRKNCYVECFEPDLHAFWHISTRILHDRFAVHNRAVAGISGLRTFFRAAPFSGGNSLYGSHTEFANQGENAATHPVFALSLESILGRLPRVDLLKLDCEGAEIEIINQTSAEAFAKVRQITVEFHGFCIKEHTPEVIDAARARLTELGFVEADINQHNYDDRLFLRP